MSKLAMSDKVKFEGIVTAVKARIRLIRSFDQISHAYLGYTLVMDATVNEKQWDDLRVAVGQKTHEKNLFRIGDHISGEAMPVGNRDGHRNYHRPLEPEQKEM